MGRVRYKTRHLTLEASLVLSAIGHFIKGKARKGLGVKDNERDRVRVRARASIGVRIRVRV